MNDRDGAPVHPSRVLTALGARLGRDTEIFVTGSGGVLLIGLANLVVLTRFLTPREFGQLAVLLILAATLTVVYNLGSLQGGFNWAFGSAGELDAGEPGVEREGEDLARDRRAALGTTLVITVVVALAGTAAVAAVAGPIAEVAVGRSGASDLVLIAAASGAVGAVWRFVLNIPRLEGRPVRFAWLQVTRPVLVLAISVPLVVAGGGVRSVLAATAIGTAAALAIGFVALRSSLRLTFKRDDAAEILRGGTPYVPVAISFWAVQSLDLVILSRFASDSDVGIYRVAWRIGSIASYFVAAFQMAWTPLPRSELFVAAERVRGRGQIQARTVTYFALASLWLLVALVAATDALVQLTGEAYEDAAPLIPLLGVSFLAYGAFIVSYRAVIFPGRQKAFVRLVVLSALVFLAVALVLTPPLGAYGAAIAPTIGFAVSALGILYLGRRSAERTPFEWGRIAAGAGVAAVCIGVERTLAGPVGAAQPIMAIVAVAAYPVALVLTGIVPREHLEPLAQIGRSLLPDWVESRLPARGLRRLDEEDRRLLDDILVQGREPKRIAHELGTTEASVNRRLVAALRNVGRLSPGDVLDAEIGAYLAPGTSEEKRGAIARRLRALGVQPAEVDAVESVAREVRRAGKGRSRRFRWRAA